jgi:hypothetical protein
MGSLKRLDLNSEKISSFQQYFIFYLIYFVYIIIYFSYGMGGYTLFKSIYSFLKNLTNIKLISLHSDFIMVYTLTIFLLFILIIIILPISLIYTRANKETVILNTKYNILAISSLIVFGIAGIIYLYLLNNLKYLSIIYLIDAYLINIYFAVYLLILLIILKKVSIYYNYIYIIPERKYLNEKNPKIRRYIYSILGWPFSYFGFLILYIYVISGIIPWYSIIFLVFNSFIIFKIIRRRYFLKKEIFYQDFYELSKYFDKGFIVFFGILAFISVFDTLNKILINNYTIQNIFLAGEKFGKIIIIYLNNIYFLPLLNIIYFYYYYNISIIFYNLNYYLHYYILQKNIDYKMDKIHNEIKNIQVNPIITFLSYLALFIVFLINLML